MLNARITLKPSEDFQYRYAFTAVGSGSNRRSPVFYCDSVGRETQPTSANYGVVLVHGLGSWTVAIYDQLATVCTRQVSTWTSIDLQVSAFPPLEWTCAAPTTQQPAIGSRIDRIREQLGITMIQLAAALQLQRATLYKWYQGRQPHPGNETRVCALESFAETWSAQKLPPLRKFWDAHIPALNLKVREILCDPLRNANALLASLPSIRAVTQPGPAIDPYTPHRRHAAGKQPSAFEQTSPPLWEHEE
jgi:transcriptional regulator with XRE-family HTH domain